MYRPENTKKWIVYDDGSHEPLSMSENINEKKHEPGREWFVADKPKDFLPDKLAPEAFHPRHKNEGYMKGILPREPEKSDPRGGYGPGAPSPVILDEIPRNYPTNLPKLPKKSPNGRVFCDGADCDKWERSNPENFELYGLNGHAAADLVTGVVRLLKNGFDPNKPNAPAGSGVSRGAVIPGQDNPYNDLLVSKK